MGAGLNASCAVIVYFVSSSALFHVQHEQIKGAVLTVCEHPYVQFTVTVIKSLDIDIIWFSSIN